MFSVLQFHYFCTFQLKIKELIMKKQVTIKDIARQLGLSVSTVSRALQDHHDISIKTRKAVKQLADILGYKPNRIALNLKNSKTNTIGLIIPVIEHNFFSSIVNGIEEVAYNNDYYVMMFQSNESYMREVLNTQTLVTNRVDGVLASFSKETRTFSHFSQVVDYEIPLVFFDRVVDNLHADTVISDDFQGAYTAVSHLIERGCRNIALFSSPRHLSISQQRHDGYKKALEDRGLEYNPHLVYSCDTYFEATKISSSILKKVDRPDGIFTVNDATALGVLKTAKKLGINIPGTLKVVGYENSKGSVMCDPELTTVDQFGFELGKQAMTLLLDRINSHTYDYIPKNIIIKPKLIVRGST
jgi:LacI family transcriptional regulator